MMSTTHIYTEIYVNEQSLPLLKYFAHIRTNHSYSNSNGIHSSNGTAVDLCSLSLSPIWMCCAPYFICCICRNWRDGRSAARVYMAAMRMCICKGIFECKMRYTHASTCKCVGGCSLAFSLVIIFVRIRVWVSVCACACGCVCICTCSNVILMFCLCA